MVNEEMKETITNAMDITMSDKMKEIIEKYTAESHYPKSQHVHNIVTGSAVKLIMDIREAGGTEDEINQAIEYLAVCIQSHKYHINVKRYSKENGIWDLRKKYQPWRIVKNETKLEGADTDGDETVVVEAVKDVETME